FSEAQNLVPNPSFETYTVCPRSKSGYYVLDEVKDAPPWQSATYGTPDYFNACDTTKTVSVPFNYIEGGSYQYARTGSAYMGVVTKVGVNNREYICAPLFSGLLGGEKYYISMYINCPNSSHPSDRIGIYLSSNYPDTGLTTGYGSGCLPVIPQIENTPGNLLSDTLNWVQISGWYTAIGGENYITIGNFSPDSLTTGVGGFYASYYYIDDICISTDSSECAKRAESIKKNVNDADVNIYPNPANNKISIDTKDETEIKLYDLLGKEILDTKEKEIDVSGFNDGVYFIQVKTSQSTYTQKIIVQH